jgi:hypothetical protein
VKWIPGVAFAILAVWLLASGRRREAGRHMLAFAALFVVLHLPFLLWSPSEATYAYRYFSGQGLTGESVWYLLLAPLGLASVPEREFWLPADVSGWADPTVTVIQALVLVLVAVAAVRVRGRLSAAVAIAAVAPVLFLLTNRVFSPQYLVPILAAWAVAGALLLTSRKEQLALGIAAMAATTANAFVYPYTLHELGLWKFVSALLFAIGLAMSVWSFEQLRIPAQPRLTTERVPSLPSAATSSNECRRGRRQRRHSVRGRRSLHPDAARGAPAAGFRRRLGDHRGRQRFARRLSADAEGFLERLNLRVVDAPASRGVAASATSVGSGTRAGSSRSSSTRMTRSIPATSLQWPRH